MTRKKVTILIRTLLCLFAISAYAADEDTVTPPAAPTATTPATATITQPAANPVTPPAATGSSPDSSSTTGKLQPAATSTPPANPAQNMTPAINKASGVRRAVPVSAPAAAPAFAPAVKPKPVIPATVQAKPTPPATPKPLIQTPAKSPVKAPGIEGSAKNPVVAAPVAQSPGAQSPATDTPPAKAAEQPVSLLKQAADIEVFIREGCLNCAKAMEFLDKLQALQPQLKINIRDVRKEPAALELLKRMAQNQENATLDYPAFVVSGQLIIGFTDEANTAQSILDNLPLLHATGEDDEACADSTAPGCGLIPAPAPQPPEHITFNVFGHSIELVQIGLPLFTIAAGLLDGLNFGSTWVLILILALLAPMKDRSKMFTIAGTFLAVQAVFYFVVMAVWFNLVAATGSTLTVQYAFAAISLAATLAYFWKYLHFGQKLSIATHEIDKPGIYTYIRKIIETETFTATLLGTMGLAMFVLLTEFSFKTIFPLLYAKVLVMQKLGSLASYSYLALYDLAYMLDDFIILAIGIMSLQPDRSAESKDNRLNLLSTLFLLATAAYFLLIRVH